MDFGHLTLFLTETMSMTEVYQPVIIRELLSRNGECTKDQLATALAEYDLSVKDYYRHIVMIWPKRTLTKHGIIQYERIGERFILNGNPEDDMQRQEAIDICDAKIKDWVKRTNDRDKAPVASGSVRYRVLRRANNKCELCGIPASLRPLDLDHITPQAKANKSGKVVRGGKPVNVHSEDNLQALCFKCNRAKGASDDTDFRRTTRLVRDRIPEPLEREGRSPLVTRKVTGRRLVTALNDKLVEEHEQYIQSKTIGALCEMVEVILCLAESKGVSQDELLRSVEENRQQLGGYGEGWLREENP